MTFLRLNFLLWLIPFVADAAYGQRYVVESGSIAFFSKATIEDIRSENKKVSSIFSVSTGNVAFSVPIRGFQFEKHLMQEHFNDKYLESHRFPTATFTGMITGFDQNKSGVQDVRAHGRLTIHGVVQDIDVPGTFQNNNGKIILKSDFKLKLADYGVKIPQLLWQNIAEVVDVTINLTYKPQ